ncbi:hypothetical protein B0I35DRAFT_446530 [Stachybotrys elegans]|uniref:Uncharacterized protein n=1 Tax=Stachybotrys elegans TaxID=80388 RepID=A0A8K0SDE8_9HYPO|nr:hypothetical protein B0I35DRAFT_446530 [Stachybotrys elegans]
MTASLPASDLKGRPAPDAESPDAESVAQHGASTTQHRQRGPRGSLYDIMRQNAGLSLFLRPICWTDRHTELLGVHFNELPPCTEPVPPTIPGSSPSSGHMRPSDTIKKLNEALTEILIPSTPIAFRTTSPIQTILETLWPKAFSNPQTLQDLHLFFGRHVYRDSVKINFLWNKPLEIPSPSSSFSSEATLPADSFNLPSAQSSPRCSLPAPTPMVCYVAKPHVASIRKRIFRIFPCPNGTINVPVQRLHELQSKQMAPANLDEDAHIIGVILAMAQRQFYGIPPPSSRRNSVWFTGNGPLPRPDFHDTKVRVLTYDIDTAEFIVYTGHVTAKFLDRFHRPRRAPSVDDDEKSGLRIEYTRVPIWPILGLREGLGKALGTEVVGPFEPSEIERWETDNTPKSRTRKRTVLAEVFNRSLEDATVEPPAPKRRRLDRGNSVQIAV